MKETIAVFSAYVLFPLFILLPFFDTQAETRPTNDSWRAVTIRSQAQKDAGLAGGEGFQVITAISYAPSNPNVVYFTVDTSQVWKSVDGGSNWCSKRNGFRSNGGTAIAVDPKNENTVFASGTKHQSTSTTYPSSVVDGIYRTIDGGDSWQLVYQTDYYGRRPDSYSDANRHFVFDPDSFNDTRHQTIYAGTHSKGMIKSTDGGNTWTQIITHTDLDKMRIIDVEIHKHASKAILYIVANNKNNNGIADSSNGLYKVTDDKGTVSVQTLANLPEYPRSIALFAAHDPVNDIIYAAVGTYKVYKSVDGGNSFTSKSKGLTVNKKEYKFVSVSPADKNYVYVRIDKTPANIFYSHDGGDTWQQTSSKDVGGLAMLPNQQGQPATTRITPHPADKNIALIQFGDTNLAKTADGGKTWTYTGNGYRGGRVSNRTAYYFDKNNRGKWIYFMVDRGVLITENNGDTWRQMDTGPIYKNGLFFDTAIVGAADPKNPNTIIVVLGKWKSGPGREHTYKIIRTTDGGNTWNTVRETLSGHTYSFLAFHPQNTNYVYAGTRNGDGWMSRDNGKTWSLIPGKTIRAMYPKNGDIIYAFESAPSGASKTKSTLWRSSDKGTTWISLGATPFSTPEEVDIDPENSNRLYAAAGKDIYVFNGTSWKSITGNIPKEDFGGTLCRTFQNLAVDPLRPHIIYAGLGTTFVGHRKAFIYRSKDYGSTWEDISYNIGAYSTVWGLAVNPHNSDVHISTGHGNYVLSELPALSSPSPSSSPPSSQSSAK